jgi:TP53 regulating kinase-like protein
MEWIDGSPIRAVLERWEVWMKKEIAQQDAAGIEDWRRAEEERVKDLMRRVGHAVGSMHKAGVIHGDLTTSNLILRPYHTPAGQQPEQFLDRNDVSDVTESPSMVGEVVLVDFGLAGQSAQDEDRAVDLYVLERAFGSTHPRTEGFFDEVLQAYQPSFKGSNSVLKRLEDVRMRGRKRSMLG